MNKQLQKKVDRAIRLLQAAQTTAGDKQIEVSYSGGKDSDVILELARMAGINYRAIYKNTTIDPPGTIAHAKENGVEVVQPRESFFKVIERKGLPSRFVRFCCSELKEYKILDHAVQGIRRDESNSRAKRYQEPQICRMYPKGERASVYLPILDWTKEDVAEFIRERGIKCHPLYYDEDGTFHPERRLGCMCCPMAYRPHRLEEFKQHPGMVKAYIRAAKKWWDARPNLKSRKYFRDIYEVFTYNVFFDRRIDFDEWQSGMFGCTDCKQFLEDYFNINL